MKLHVGHLRDGRYAICDDHGARVFYCRARGFQAAVLKWVTKHVEEPDSMVSYRDGRMRVSEWAATVVSLKFDRRKEDAHAGNRNSS